MSVLIGIAWGLLVWFKLPKAYHSHFWLVLFGGCVVIGVIWQLLENAFRRRF